MALQEKSLGFAWARKMQPIYQASSHLSLRQSLDLASSPYRVKLWMDIANFFIGVFLTWGLYFVGTFAFSGFSKGKPDPA
jgi:hypothetical protein